LGFRKENEVTSVCAAGTSELTDSVERQREGEGGSSCQSKSGKIRIQRNEDRKASV